MHELAAIAVAEFQRIGLGDLIQAAGMIGGAIALVVGLRQRLESLSEAVKELTASIKLLDKRSDEHDLLLTRFGGDIDRIKGDLHELKNA